MKEENEFRDVFDTINRHDFENGTYYQMNISKYGFECVYLTCANKNCKVTTKWFFDEEKKLAFTKKIGTSHGINCTRLNEKDLPMSPAQREYIINFAKLSSLESSEFATPTIVYNKIYNNK
jgi:hypothetical protein